MLSVINGTGVTLFSHCTNMGCIRGYENTCKMYKVTQEKGIPLKLPRFHWFHTVHVYSKNIQSCNSLKLILRSHKKLISILIVQSHHNCHGF